MANHRSDPKPRTKKVPKPKSNSGKITKKRLETRKQRDVDIISSRIKNVHQEDLVLNVENNLIANVEGCKASKMKLIQNIGFRQSDSATSTNSSKVDLVYELRSTFLNLYENIAQENKVKNEDKQMEMERQWYSTLGLICKALDNNLEESSVPFSKECDILISILKNYSESHSLSDIVSVFHAVAHSTFEILMKVSLGEDTINTPRSNANIDLNNNKLEFIDGDQQLRLITLAGGCLGQMMSLHKEARNKKGQPNIEYVNFITSITMSEKEKNTLEVSLKDRDRGGLLFPRKELNHFLLIFERELNKVANKETMKLYGANAIKVICSHMKNAIILQEEFEKAVSNMEEEDHRLFDLKNRETFFEIFARKLVHARVGAFFSSYNQLKVDARKGMSKGGSMLRDDLYGFATNKKKKKKTVIGKKLKPFPKDCDKKKLRKPKRGENVTEAPLASPDYQEITAKTKCDNAQPSSSGIKNSSYLNYKTKTQTECDLNSTKEINPQTSTSLFPRSKRIIKPRKILDL